MSGIFLNIPLFTSKTVLWKAGGIFDPLTPKCSWRNISNIIVSIKHSPGCKSKGDQVPFSVSRSALDKARILSESQVTWLWGFSESLHPLSTIESTDLIDLYAFSTFLSVWLYRKPSDCLAWIRSKIVDAIANITSGKFNIVSIPNQCHNVWILDMPGILWRQIWLGSIPSHEGDPTEYFQVFNCFEAYFIFGDLYH